MKNDKNNTKSRYQQIANKLREQIIHGDIKPGQKMPTFDDMVTNFDTSRSIVQLAVSQLRDQGFVRPDGRRGMYVEQHPPSLYRFGILFPCHPGDNYWSRFNTSLTHEAMRLQSQCIGYRFACYYNLHEQNVSEDFKRLREDVQNRTLAGIMVMPYCDYVLEDPVIQQSDIPVLHLFGSSTSGRLPSLTTDHDRYLRDKVFPAIKRFNPKRLAAVSIADRPTFNLLSMIETAGLTSRRSWIQYVGRDHPETVRRIIWLLFELPKDRQPDCLLILDDNLLEHVMLGLADCHLQPGLDVHIFSQNNWPSETPRMQLIHRFGVHTGQLLIAGCRTLDKMRQGQTVPEFQSMPSWFENEIPTSVTFSDELPPLICTEIL